MAKIKAAFGSFSPDGGSVTYAAGPHDDTYEQTGVTSGDLTQHTKVVNVIKNKCKIHSIYWFNSTSNETRVTLLDWNDSKTTTLSDIITYPKNYTTTVPRDATFSATWNPDLGVWDFDVTIAADLYDTPSGIYETFPKPGLHFQDGVGVMYEPTGGYNVGADPETMWVIFYSE